MLARRSDGTPTGWPMILMIRDGQLEITTYRKAAKSKALLADDRVCCVVPDPEVPGRGVAIAGRARPWTSEGFLANVGAAEQDSPIPVPDSVRQSVRERLSDEKRMVFRIDVERITALEAWSPDAAV